MYALYVMYMRIPIFIGEIENILLRSYYNRCFFFSIFYWKLRSMYFFEQHVTNRINCSCNSNVQCILIVEIQKLDLFLASWNFFYTFLDTDDIFFTTSDMEDILIKIPV